MTTPDFGRVPPHDIAAEQCVLGGMLLSPAAIGDVAAVLAPDAHYRPAHTVIHESVLRLFEAGEPVDAITVAGDLTRRGEITRVGGPLYLHELIAAVPVAANAGHYARIVAGHKIRRRLIENATRIVQMAYSGEDDAAEVADRARQEIVDATTGPSQGAPRSMRDLVYAVIGDVEKGTERGLPTPWADLTRALSGLAPGQLIILAARPGMGKSICGMQFAAETAMNLGLPALLVSMEMTAEEITLRLISGEARVPLTNLLNREVSEAEWDRISRHQGSIAEAPLVIEDSRPMSLALVRARLRDMARENPARILVVDYLGLLETPAKAESRNLAVAAMSRELKLIAGEFDIPVVALAQLSRAPEQRPDKRPVASDLRDSGAQEQDADVVILLHRPDAYDPECARAGEIDLIVAKNRTGPQCTVTLTFQGHYGRVRDMAPETWSPSAQAVS